MKSKRQSKLKLLWLQSITCNGNTQSFLNHPDLFSILSAFEVVHHPVIESNYTIKDLTALQIPCDILIIEGSYIEKGFTKDGIEVSKMIEYYAKAAEYIITASTCATFGGVFKHKDPQRISGLCFDAEERTNRYEQYRSKLISLPGCPIHPQ